MLNSNKTYLRLHCTKCINYSASTDTLNLCGLYHNSRVGERQITADNIILRKMFDKIISDKVSVLLVGSVFMLDSIYVYYNLW